MRVLRVNSMAECTLVGFFFFLSFFSEQLLEKSNWIGQNGRILSFSEVRTVREKDFVISRLPMSFIHFSLDVSRRFYRVFFRNILHRPSVNTLSEVNIEGDRFYDF